MTTVLKLSNVSLPGSGYPHIATFAMAPDLPVKGGLIGLYAFSKNEMVSVYNHADPSKPLIKVGSPTINKFGALLSKNHCFDSTLLSAGNVTFMAVAKPIKVSSNEASALLISNFASGTPVAGDSLGFRGSPANQAGGFGGRADGSTTAAPVDISAANENNWNFFATRITAAGNVRAYWGSNGSLVSPDSVPGSRAVETVRTLRVGGHYGLERNGVANVALAAIFHSSLDAGQVQSNYEYLRDVWAPAFGVNTL